MLTLYENEIKKRWDQRAQIKDKFVFPRKEEICDAMDVEPKSSDGVQKQNMLKKEQKISARIDDRKSQQRQNNIKNLYTRNQIDGKQTSDNLGGDVGSNNANMNINKNKILVGVDIKNKE